MARIFNNPIDVADAIQNKLYPTVMMWNRLEGRPRTHNFDKALKGEVRDALWMLCKQWQMGEFTGEDAGSPVFSKIKVSSSNLSGYGAAQDAHQPIDNRMPLEAVIEQKQIPMQRNVNKISLDIRLQLGKYWGRLLRGSGLDSYIGQYVDRYGFSLPARDRATDHIFAHKDELQQWIAVSGRCVDGYEIIQTIYSGDTASKNITLDPADELTVNDLGNSLVRFYENNFVLPQIGNAWLPDRLEYKASVTDDSPTKNQLNADEYYHGHLDWYSFNLESATNNLKTGTSTFTDTFIPTPVEFDGMPDKRWWKFEDGKTSFGDITPATTDLSKLLLIEFGLTFANDWFMLPFTLPTGSISEIQGLSVTNNFGDNLWLESTEKEGFDVDQWRVFRQSSAEVNKMLFLCPSAIKVQESNPIEEVMFIRDEVANMVWGIEKIVASTLGKGVQGGEYAVQKRQYHENMIGPGGLMDYKAEVYYKAMTDVPEHWIPFIPVHADGHKRQIQLQRGSMLRIIDGDSARPEKIKPLTSLLREGLDIEPKPLPYLIHEEEITRSGVRVTQGFQRTRGLDGSVYVWFGAKKKTGRGEGHSGLAFDQLEPVKNK